VSAEHLLYVSYENGSWDVDIECPHAALGKDRPCAVWADEDGTERHDECTFQQYADACYLEDWLRGSRTFGPVAITAVGAGDDWQARFADA
jgi:hypothetical protein